jgi:hypothetical protein
MIVRILLISNTGRLVMKIGSLENTLKIGMLLDLGAGYISANCKMEAILG